MERRDFVKKLAVGMAAVPFLPQIGAALTSRLEGLRASLEGDLATDRFWRRVQQEFTLHPDLVHMNTGSTGAVPQLVLDALCSYARQIEGDPLHNTWGGVGSGMEAVRAQAAAFLGADKDEVAITRNTTEGMNATAVGLHLRRGDEVLTTDHEHGGGMACWQYLARHHGVKVRYLEIPDPVQSPQQMLDLVAKHLTRKTRVCSFSHVCTISGMVFPLAEVAALTRPRDIVLVCDGAQVPGMLQVDVKQLGVDVYCSSSHKWMLAPKGSGLFYIRKEMQERIKPPMLADGMAVYTGACGTRNVPTILAHGAAIEFMNTIGPARVEARCLELAGLVKERLSAIPGLTCLSPEPPEMRSGLTTFGVDPARGRNGELVSRLFADYQIVAKPAQGTYAYVPPSEAHPRNPNAIRISTHIYNDEDQVERLATALRRLLV